MSNNIPVDIEFLLKNINVEDEAGKIKKAIINIEETTDKVADRVEADLVGSLHKAGTEADKMNAKFKGSAAGINQAGKSFNTLNHSVQQVARELPSLAISPQTFILAISNNLPILQDQLRKTRLQNEALKASGQSTVPVWKQVIKSIFSWQTAMVAGITILTVFGKDIFNAIGRMLKFKDSVELTRQEIKKLTQDLGKEMGSEIGKFNLLFDNLINARRGTDEYYGAKAEIIKQYGKYLTGLDDEITRLNNIEGAYQAITKAIIENSKQKILSNIYQEEGEKLQQTKLDQYQILRKALIDEYDENLGQVFFNQIIKELEAGKGFSDATKQIIEGFNESVYDIYDQTFDEKSKITVNKVKDSLDEITNAQSIFNKKTEEAQKTFGNLFKSDGKQQAKNREYWDNQVKLVTTQINGLDTSAANFANEKARLEKELRKYQAEIAKFEVEDNSKKNKKSPFAENLDEKKKDYEAYSAAVRQVGKEWADYNFQILLKDGKNFQQYLEQKSLAYRDNFERMKEIALAAQSAGIYLFWPQGLDPMKPKKVTPIKPAKVDSTTLAEDTGLQRIQEYRKKLLKKIDIEKLQDYGNALLDTAYMFGDIAGQLSGVNDELADYIDGIAKAAQNAGNLITGIVSENPFQAISGGIGLLINAFEAFSTTGNQDGVASQLEKINKTLEHQSSILAHAEGESWFLLATKQVDDYRISIEATTAALQGHMNQFPKGFLDEYRSQYDQYLNLLEVQIRASVRGMTNLTDEQKEALIEARLMQQTPTFENWAISEGIENPVKNWTPDEFIQAIHDGTIDLDEKAKEYLAQIMNERAEQLRLMEEQLGFSADEVTSSLADGIIEGLKLAENGLGDFAETFGSLMQKWGRRALEQFLYDKLMIDWFDDFYEMAKDGLDPAERDQAESGLVDIIKEGQNVWAEILPMLEMYSPSGTSGLVGKISAATEETMSFVGGRLVALSVDLKEFTARVVAGQVDFDVQIGYLKTISENTNYNKQIPDIVKQLKNMNTYLKNLN